VRMECRQGSSARDAVRVQVQGQCSADASKIKVYKCKGADTGY
jgi:hypothetical protein